MARARAAPKGRCNLSISPGILVGGAGGVGGIDGKGIHAKPSEPSTDLFEPALAGMTPWTLRLVRMLYPSA